MLFRSMIPIMGNTINSIDVLNGVASGFTTIASFALSISLFILQNYEIGIICLCLSFASLAFNKYHKFPSKVFPGDSGAITFGAAYGASARGLNQPPIVFLSSISPTINEKIGRDIRNSLPS